MDLSRRRLLGVLSCGVTAGCLGGGDDGETPTATSAGTSTVRARTTAVRECDPGSIERPPVVTDESLPATGYGAKPRELTPQTVADYLTGFETAFARNRLLASQGPLDRLDVETATAWTPDEADGGFLASSRIEISYTEIGSDIPVQQSHVANYYVTAGPVYRVEDDSGQIDPRTHPDAQLVEC